MNRNILRPLIAAVGIVGAVAGSTAPSNAGDKLAAESAVAHQVLLAADPLAAYNALGPDEQKLFADAFADQDVSTTEGPAVATTEAPFAVASPYSTNPGGGGGGAGCWSKYLYHEWSDFGIHDGNSRMELDWCNDLYGNFTKHVVTNVGGQGLGGVGYQGVIGSGARTVSGQYRTFREYKFTLAGVAANPCLQIRGATGGSSSTSTSCNLS